MRVLYVEDNPANVALVKRVARVGNHEIINYIDGDRALEKFNEIAPDLVLMDIQLAGSKNGLDVVKILRERGITTTIIAVTAYAMVGDKERALAAGCDAYLAKPLPVQQLVEIFQEHAERVASIPEAAEAKPATPIATPAEPAKPANDETATIETPQPIHQPVSQEAKPENIPAKTPEPDENQSAQVDKNSGLSDTAQSKTHTNSASSGNVDTSTPTTITDPTSPSSSDDRSTTDSIIADETVARE